MTPMVYRRSKTKINLRGECSLYGNDTDTYFALDRLSFTAPSPNILFMEMTQTRTLPLIG